MSCWEPCTSYRRQQCWETVQRVASMVDDGSEVNSLFHPTPPRDIKVQNHQTLCYHPARLLTRAGSPLCGMTRTIRNPRWYLGIYLALLLELNIMIIIKLTKWEFEIISAIGDDKNLLHQRILARKQSSCTYNMYKTIVFSRFFSSPVADMI